jgi:small-conductance mechanosensitive channel
MARPTSASGRQYPEGPPAARRRAIGRAARPKRGVRASQQARQPRGRAVSGAQNQLKKFRQGSILAIAITGFLLLLLTPGEAGYAQEGEGGALTQAADTLVVAPISGAEMQTAAEAESLEAAEGPGEPIARVAKDEAVGAVQRLWRSFYSNLPKLLVALAILVVAWLFARFMRWLLHRLLSHWERASATITLANIIIWLFAIGLAISVLVGDIRAMVGSLGLIGLALSWSLQSPIESFTGWLFNSFKGYYRIGDRISVGDVVGDVYKIDFLTTTVWEIGSPFRAGYLQAEQPTGRLVTFPNNEVLAGSVVNYTSDFEYVWDELAISIANESDIRLAMNVLQEVASVVIGDYMREPALKYEQILRRAGLPYQIAQVPQVYLSLDDSWTNVIIRYLVGARERRKWKTELILATAEELHKPDYKGKIISVYPRQQLQLINTGGAPVAPDHFNGAGPA